MNKGYTYTGVNGEPMIELHVDDHEDLQKYGNKNMAHLEETQVSGILTNLSSSSAKTNLYTINFNSEVSSGLGNQEREHSYQSPMVQVS